MSEDSTTDEIKHELDRFRADFESLRREVGKVIVGLSGLSATPTALIAGVARVARGVPGWARRWLAASPPTRRASFSGFNLRPTYADLIETTFVAEDEFEGGARRRVSPRAGLRQFDPRRRLQPAPRPSRHG